MLDSAPQSNCATVDREPVLADPVARSAALDLHEGIGTPRPKSCSRWPARMRLLSSAGEVVKGRCRSTNKCDYCATLAAVEDSEMLALDALMGEAPTVYVVVTTADATIDTGRFKRSHAKLVKAWRHRCPGLEYGRTVEYTSGRAGTSGGKRRPHWNYFLKGVTEADVPALREVVDAVWCGREKASPKAQYVGSIAECGGLMRYLTLHFLKESQRPPAGWSGHRLSLSRGYLAQSTSVMRELTKKGLRLDRELHKARESGLDAIDAEMAAAVAIAFQESLSWQLVTWDDVQERAARRLWSRVAVQSSAQSAVRS